MDLIHSLFYEHTGLQRESQIQMMFLSDGFYVLFSGMAEKCVKSLCRMWVPLWPSIEVSFIENCKDYERQGGKWHMGRYGRRQAGLHKTSCLLTSPYKVI